MSKRIRGKIKDKMKLMKLESCFLVWFELVKLIEKEKLDGVTTDKDLQEQANEAEKKFKRVAKEIGSLDIKLFSLHYEAKKKKEFQNQKEMH